jgi:glyoxylase I family protein
LTDKEQPMMRREARKDRTHDATADESAVRAFPLQMIDAWNAGDGAAFAAPFSDSADFIAFEGTHLKGRRAIAEFHQRLFDTELAGTRLEGDVKFVRFLKPDVAVMHARAGTYLAGRAKTTPSRESMQIFVAVKQDSEWRVESLLNARKLTLEQQFFADEFGSLSTVDKRAVGERLRLLRDGAGVNETRAEADQRLIEDFHGVRYQVEDVERSVAFYTQTLGFELEHQQLPDFAAVSVGALKILLSGRGASGSRPMPNGVLQEPGGWNRVVLRVADIDACIQELKAAGLRFRNQVEAGPGGKQIQAEDPDGNPIELFEPARRAP